MPTKPSSIVSHSNSRNSFRRDSQRSATPREASKAVVLPQSLDGGNLSIVESILPRPPRTLGQTPRLNISHKLIQSRIILRQPRIREEVRIEHHFIDHTHGWVVLEGIVGALDLFAAARWVGDVVVGSRCTVGVFSFRCGAV